MAYVADLHIHSRFARACSSALNIPNLAKWAKFKGINLVGTGDCLHPLWQAELKKDLKNFNNGVYEYDGVKFLATTEIACIYSERGKTYRIHTLIFLPSLESAQKLSEALVKKGANISSDGRPILGLSSKLLCELVFSVETQAIIIPAHIWTPHFSLYGSNSGYDKFADCYGEFSDQIYGVETGLSCYDPETEVLTEVGWKKFSEVQGFDKICSLNINTDQIKFQKPTLVVSYRYAGEMYRLKTRRVDLLVTPNHNLLYSPCDFRKRKPYSLKQARLLFGKSKIFKKDGIWMNKDPLHFVLPAVAIKHGSHFYSGSRQIKEKKIPLNEWLRFFGFWLAEGWVSQGNNGDYNILVANNNQKILTYMKQLLESWGFNVFMSKNILRVRNYQLLHYLKNFGKSSEKYIPLEIKSLSSAALKLMFEYYIKGDGHVNGRNGKGLSAVTISIRLRDDLQEIALKMGMSAYYKLHNKKGTPITSLPYKKKEYLQSQDSWVVYFIRQNRPIILPSQIKKYNYIESWVNYDGLVFCVTIPNHVIYIRRNGIPLWCGNSEPAMNWRIKDLDNKSIVSFSDLHSLPRLGREVTIFKGELSYQGLLNDLKTQNILGTIEFFPEEGRYHYSGHRNCNVVLDPEGLKKNGVICPVCKRSLTIGVMQRVEDLATRSEAELELERKDGITRSKKFPEKAGFRMLVQLEEILAEAMNSTVSSQKVKAEYERLVTTLDSELKILTKTPIDLISMAAGEKVAEGVKKVRAGDIHIEPGFDNTYGVVKIWDDVEEKAESKEQISLF